MRGIRLIALAGLALVPASIALASDQPGTTADQWKEELSGQVMWQESATDAGKFMADANLTRGGGPLNRITGSMVRQRDVDMFCIDITDPTSFSATVTGTDYFLALFRVDGTGVAYNDNDPAGGTGSKLTAAFVADETPGLYFLAIGRMSSFSSIFNMPLDGGGNSIFHTSPPTVRNVEYDANMGVGALASWSYNSTGFEPFNSNYTINLTGTGYHQLPAPGAALLLGLGGVALGRRRR